MYIIIDKCILFLYSSLFLLQLPGSVQQVVFFLLSFTIAVLQSYSTDIRIKYALAAFFFLLCFPFPPLLLFLPLIIYDCIQNRLYGGFAFFIPFFYHIGSFLLPTFGPLFLTVFCLEFLLAPFLAIKSKRIRTLEQEMIRLRDSSTELTLVLKEKNKTLLEKQDSEVYLATLKERNRIAREIHDNVGHMLTRSILQIGALTTLNKEGALHDQLVSVNDTLNSAMTSIRESVHDLHNDSIDLKQAVLEAAKPMQDAYQIQIDYDMSAVVPRKIKFCFINTVKEALSNIVKHSNAQKIFIILREHPAFFQLSIEDDGTIFPSELVEGLGLLNMKDRVETLQGTFRVQTNKGFKIFITIKKDLNEE